MKLEMAARLIIFSTLIFLPVLWSSMFSSRLLQQTKLPAGVCLQLKSNKEIVANVAKSYSEDYPDEYEIEESTTVVEKKPVYTCCPDWKEMMHEPFHSRGGYPICEPNCNNCRHGHCISPNNCRCHIGYRKDTNNVCVAQCPTGCPGAVCVTPNHCKPVSAFRPDSCNITDCVNGCNVSVGLCLCVGGFEKINATVCEPKCEKPCGHGYCAEPNRCNCDIGYQFDANAKQCVPICRNGCIGGKCLEPDKCVCGDGYRLETSSGDAHICVSISDSCKPCPNISCDPNDATGSTTSSIGYCRCGPGYAFINSICTPLCLNVICVNGRCSAPEKCSCLKNYRPLTDNRTDICIPICDISCMKHGNCIDKNNCQCDPGYISLPSRPMECLPQCSPACRSGEICISPPDICGCRMGYEWENGDCKPRCSKPCINGYCILPEKCVCDFGVSANNGSCLPTKPTTTISSVGGHQTISTMRTSPTSGFPVVFCTLTMNDSDVQHFDQFSLNVDYSSRIENWLPQLGPGFNTTCKNLQDYTPTTIQTGKRVRCYFKFRDTYEGTLECTLNIILNETEVQTKDTCKPVLYHFRGGEKTILVTSSSVSVKSMDDFIMNERDKCTKCPSYFPTNLTVHGVQLKVQVHDCSSFGYTIYTDYQRAKHFKIYAYIVVALVIILLVSLFAFAHWKKTINCFIRRGDDQSTKRFSDLTATS